jgi:hypothetical protein
VLSSGWGFVGVLRASGTRLLHQNTSSSFPAADSVLCLLTGSAFVPAGRRTGFMPAYGGVQELGLLQAPEVRPQQQHWLTKIINFTSLKIVQQVQHRRGCVLLPGLGSSCLGLECRTPPCIE